MNKAASSNPWSIPLSVHDVPPEGQDYHVVADVRTRALLAENIGVREIPRLEASFHAVPYGTDGLHLTGQVSAAVGQTCVVTLDPVEGEVEEAIDLTFVPDPATAAAADLRKDLAEEDIPEALVDGSVDLGAIATEFLILGLDPYPRKPGAIFAPASADKSPNNPFGVLAAWKKNVDKTGG